MSLKSLPIPPIPEETARVAQAIFPRGNVIMQLRDALGSVYTDEAFADLFPTHGQPAFSPWRLALVTVFQFLEGLTDRQAADAVRDRLAWKYALSLELTDPGFDHSVLAEFRARLVQGRAEQRLLDLLLERCREEGWLKARGRQRTDSTHVLIIDPCAQSDVARGADDGLCLECPGGSSARVGACPGADRLGGALWSTARRGALAQRRPRAPAVC